MQAILPVTDSSPVIVSGMPPKIILTRESGSGSANFSDRVLLFDTKDLAREKVCAEYLGTEDLGMVVTRAASENTSNTDNAVFDCQVSVFRLIFDITSTMSGSVKAPCCVFPPGREVLSE